MNIVELFAGSRSFSKVAESRGHDTFTSDITAFEDIDYVCDIMDFDPDHVPFDHVDVVWASIPCHTWSIASCSTHWTKEEPRKPKSEAARKGLDILERTLMIILYLQPDYFFIENPRGLLRKANFMIPMNDMRHTVTYCQYGDSRMKPTDIWTNMNWDPKPMCKNGDPCHERAPRGSKAGTQGLKNKYERSIVPVELCEEIIDVLGGLE